jgi:hypothetical protein
MSLYSCCYRQGEGRQFAPVNEFSAAIADEAPSHRFFPRPECWTQALNEMLQRADFSLFYLIARRYWAAGAPDVG